jgi:hypothetical protein
VGLPGQSAAEVNREQLLQLPRPVRRYLELTNVLGRPSIRTVRLKQHGALRGSERGRWLWFTAEQQFTTSPPSFVWQARLPHFPAAVFSARDAFAKGRGELKVTLLRAFKIVDVRGPEVDQGELLRYLAETVWFPTVWLAEYMQWETLNDRSAKATLRQADLAVSAVFEFNPEGLPERISGERYATLGRNFVLRPFSGRCSEFSRSGRNPGSNEGGSSVASARKRVHLFSS